MEQEMEKTKGGKIEESEEKWVHDASVDYKGRVPLRASTAIEFSERVSYFGIATNLISYLTKVIHEDLKTAAKNVNYWSGTTTLVPLVGGFLADAYTGRFYMGLSLLTMSQFIPSLKACNTKMCLQPRKVHEVVFFLSLYCISLGTGGYKPCLESFGADQFDDDYLEERKKKMSFFNWWNFALCFALLLGATVVVYVQDFVSWGAASLILTIFMALTIIAFYVGKPFYRYRRSEGNPLKSLIQVLIAAIKKRNLSCPSNPALLHEVPESENSQRRLLSHTNRLRFLDKAAIIEEKHVEHKNNPWRLATVTRVEETKLIVNVVPIWLTSLTAGVCVAQGSTLFVKQAAAMNLNISESFKIPPASMASVSAVGTLIAVPIYDKIIVPILRKVTGNERGISILRRIGVGLTLSVILMVVAALVEAKRLRMAADEVLTVRETRDKTMSVLWLIPQYLILGVGDSFSIVGLQEYFYDQVPDSMRSLGMSLYLSVLGTGFFLSSFLIIIVDKVTEKNGKSWIAKDINSSRLDRFYWMLAVINALDLCAFVFVAKRYTYKALQKRAMETHCCKNHPWEDPLGTVNRARNGEQGARKKKMSFFNWWSFTVCFAMLIGATMVVYVQDFVSWGAASLILTILMAFTTIAFYAGRPSYRYKCPEGNTLRPILQVLVAAIRKRNLSCPSNPALLYELPQSEKSQGRLLSPTSSLRQGVEIRKTRVEETKLVVDVVPIWLTSLTAGVCVAQASTVFVKQATAMNLKISNSIILPPASLVSCSYWCFNISANIQQDYCSNDE
ncbi:Protein NRT1/ PTR FAMILY 5.7, partial [Mucuna pruriens]